MKIRLIALLAVVALAVMAVPASAHPSVNVLQGNAEVTPLGLPPSSVTGTWHLTGTLTGGESGTVDVKGALGPNAAQIGASCGMSQGTAGNGTASGHSVENVGWITSAGGTIPATGTHSGGNPLIAIVQAQGGAANCLSGQANNFVVVGAVALL